MQSRRHDEFVAVSPNPRENSRKHRYEMGTDQFQLSRRNVHSGDRSPQAGTRRSVSPQRGVDVSQRVLVRDKRSDSTERRAEYGLHMGGGGGGRTDKARSQSPPFDQVKKRPHFDEEIVHRKYDHSGDIDYDANDNTRLKQVYKYDHGAARISKEKDFSDNRIAGIDGHGLVAQKNMPIEDEAVRELHRLPPDLGPTSNYGETAGHFQYSSRTTEMGRFEHEKLRYMDSMPRDKIPAMEPYKADKPMLHSRDDSYNKMPASYSKDFASASQFKDFENSSGISRGEVMDTYRDGTLWHSQDFSSRKIRESVGYDAYGQRSHIDSGIDPEVRQRHMVTYQRGEFSPTRVEREDYFYPKSRGITNDDHEYRPGTIHRTIPSRAQLDYDHTLLDYDHRDVSRSTIMNSVLERGEIAEDSFGILRKTSIWDHPSQKPTAPDYLDMTRTSNGSKQRDEYMGSGHTHMEYSRRVSRDHEMLQMDIPHEQQISYMRPDQGFGRDSDSGNQKERHLDISSMSRYEPEMHRRAVRTYRMEEEELGIYEPADRMLKRKYRMEDDIIRHDSRSIMSSKRNAQREYEDLRYCDEDWANEDMRRIYPSRPVGFDYDDYGEAERTYREHRHHHIEYASDDLLPSRFSSEHTRRYSVRSYKHGNANRYAKGHSRPVSYNWYNTNNFNRKGVYQKQHKFLKRNDDYHDDEQGNDDEPSEDWENAAISELSEESEEFTKLVHEAFLKYSKKLNMNPGVRRRYLEQGKAGSLFCIVCGRSFSKEFMDTQRLGTHAFMSHKVGLRVQHLGLLKAICVLLGWSSVVAPETITWVPEVLPDAEALAQKEDLILWPPLVIIHKFSLINRNPEEQKVSSAEGLEAFLRGKGFVGGKIKVCQGKPGDESIMVVKFLGTFTGLENAERLHKYFADNQHGRVDFEQISSQAGKTGNRGSGGAQGDKVEELVLYGYMGIVEDLDKLDYSTKKISLIESKKGIQDIANEPVKQEER